MLGWTITVSQPLPALTGPEDPRADRLAKAASGDDVDVDDPTSLGEYLRVATWNAALGGTRWLNVLVGNGDARQLLSNGYPSFYVFYADAARKMNADGVYLDVRGGSDKSAPLLDLLGAEAQGWLVAEIWDES